MEASIGVLLTPLTGDPVAASSIARRSLLVEEGAGRYRFHEPVRQAAASRLTDQERRGVEIAHARHYLARLTAAAPNLATWESGRLTDALVADLDNYRAAWTRAVTHGLVRELGEALDGLCTLFEAAGLMIEGSTMIGATVAAFMTVACIRTVTSTRPRFSCGKRDS